MWLNARIAERGYDRAGAPTLRRLSFLAGGRHLLPVSTAGRIVAGQVLPAGRQQCLAFLDACGIGLRLRVRWAHAYDRITATAPVLARGWEDFHMTAAEAALRVERERHAQTPAAAGATASLTEVARIARVGRAAVTA